MKIMLLQCFVSLLAAISLTAATGPQAAFQQPGRLGQVTNRMHGETRAAAPTPRKLYVWVQPVGRNAQAVLGAAAAKKPASVGAVWIVTLIYAIYLSVPLGIVLLLLPHGSGGGAIDEQDIVPARPKMKKPHDGGPHPLHAWLLPQPRHA